MNEIQLIINDESLDLKPSEKIATTFQAQSFAEIADKKGGFSRSFTVPCTDKNKRLLQYTSDFLHNTNFPYREHKALLIVGGTELQSGKIIIENDGVSEREIRLTYYTGNSPFFQFINQKNLKEICLGDGNHFFSFQEIARGNLPASGDPYELKYFYPLIDYSGNNLDFSGGNRVVYYENLYPAVWASRALSGIEDFIGYKFTGRLLTTDDFKWLFYPTSEEYERDSNYHVRNTWETLNTTTETLNFGGAGFLNLTADTNKVVLTNNFINYTPNTGNFLKLAEGTGVCKNTIIPYANIAGTKNLTMLFCDTVRLNFKITFDMLALAGGSGTGGILFQFLEYITNPIPKEWFLNDPNVASSVEYWGNPINAKMKLTNLTTAAVYNGSPSSVFSGGSWYYWITSGAMPIGVAGDNFAVEIEFDVDVKAHTNYYFRFDSDLVLFEYTNFNCKCSFVEDKGTSSDDRKIALLDHNQSVWSKAVVSGNTPLPKVKISEFIKAIAQQFGCIVIVDDDKKEVEFFTIEELYENITHAKDWSKNVVNNDNAKWNTRANGYGRTSVFKYDNEEDVSDVLGEYRMTVDDETLPDEIENIKLIYSATEMRTTEDGISYPYIFRVETGTEYSGGKQRVLYCNYLTTGFPNAPTGLTIRNNPAIAGVSYSYTTSFIPLCFFNQTNMDIQLGFDSYLFGRYYKYLEIITDKFKNLSVELLLNPSEIALLNFRIPIYLSQYASYFYVEKIQDWIPNKPCKVQLLKLQ